jgi:hypothetical protein
MADLGMYEIMCKNCKGTLWKMLVPGQLIYGTQRIHAISECAECGEQFVGPFNRQDLKAPEPKRERA